MIAQPVKPKLIKPEPATVNLRVLSIQREDGGGDAVGVPLGGAAFQSIHPRDLPRVTFRVDSDEAAEMVADLIAGVDVRATVELKRVVKIDRPVLQTSA